MPGEIDALVTLLEDDSKKVILAVTSRLIELGPDAADALAVASRSGSARTRARAREILIRLERSARVTDLIAFAERPDPDLEEGVLRLAMVHSPVLTSTRLTQRLDELAERIRSSVLGANSEEGRLRALVTGIHDTLGFCGDTDDFYDYDNNFVHTVIERRRGNPISLITLYILLGRRLDIPIQAVGTPLQALAWFSGDEFTTYVDAFGGGRLWQREDCVEFLRTQGFLGPGYEQYLKCLSDRQILERVTYNLINYCNSNDRPDEHDLFRRVARALVEHRGADTTGAVFESSAE